MPTSILGNVCMPLIIVTVILFLLHLYYKMLLIVWLLACATCSSLIQSADDSESEVQCRAHNSGEEGLSVFLPEKIFEYAVNFRQECLLSNNRIIAIECYLSFRYGGIS